MTEIKSFAVGIVVVVLISACVVFSQDLATYELIDNESVGLTVAPYSKYGMAVGDINKDGYPEIFCIRWNGGNTYSRLYLNQGGIFLDISSQTPLPQIEGQGESETRTTLFVDYDNDGDQDLSFSSPKAIYLLRNDNNTFVDVSQSVGFVGKKPSGFITSWAFTIGGWADYDLDGDLDCVVVQENNKDLYLFRNDQGHFTDVAAQAGLTGTVLANTSSLTWTDFDLDGDPDLYAGLYFFRNDHGVFADATEALGFAGLSDVSQREMFDYDNDGDLDFFKAVSSATTAGTNEIWENRNGVFVNVTADVGLTVSRDRYRGMTIGDFDNDGDKDIFLQLNIDPSLDYLLVNDELESGARAFENVAEFAGISKTGDRKGSAFLDYDMDGFLDVYLPSAEHNHILYHNLADNDANWIGFMLQGVVSNRDAVGSLVTVYTGAKKQICYTVCGNGFVRQDNPHVHFGIGFETQIDSVVIQWPLGLKQTLTNPAINQYHRVKEPEATRVEHREALEGPNSFELAQNYPNPFNPSTTIAFSLLRQSQVQLTIYNVAGKEIQTLIDGTAGKGAHTIRWNGCDAAGNPQPAGVYFCRLQSQDGRQVRKMLLVR